ncbi:MAG: PorV/PorQ family protein [Candidatus Delongbacteria bacterium]|nr:PorV/PorQ family protein [Candidatus Delongbacteria bacterium]MBN2833883.1 PorV/PorQ family protein [Candidatus Delongbacteria bacterium]
MKIITILMILLASLVYSDNGSMAGSFLRYGMDARSEALGRAVVSDNTNYGYSYFFNPSNISLHKKNEVMVNYRKLALDRNLGSFSYIYPATEEASIAFNWNYAMTTDFDEYDNDGNKTGNFDYAENAICMTFGVKLKNELRIGFTGKYLWAVIPEFDSSEDNVNATGIALDIGAGYDLKIKGEIISLGAAARNIKGSFKWNSDKIYSDPKQITNDFPTSYDAGASYSPSFLKDLTIYSAYGTSSENYKEYRTGAEYSYQNGDNLFQFRAGHNNTNPAFGFGYSFAFKSVIIASDIAYSIEETDENPVTLSLKCLF